MKLVIFDLDGTLIDSVQHFVETVTASFTAIGQPVPDETTIRSVSGITAWDAMALLAPGESPDRVTAILDSYRTHYRARAGVQREPLFLGALELLDRLGAEPGTILAVATGKGYQGAITLLERHGIITRFDSIQTPDHNRGKPDPQMIETAMARVGADRHQTVMIGDTIHDMRMARAAGVAGIGVSWGYHPTADLIREGATALVERFDELDPTIARLVERHDA
jgi:phosphoglycolate phosphatase